MTSGTQARGAIPPATQAHRVIFIDFARAVAVVFMLYGHTVSAMLAPEYQQGTWFDIWLFQRGLTSSLFMLLGGFAFSIATARHWQSHVTWSWSMLKRLRRFALFVVLGYALHLPVSRLTLFRFASPESWQLFLACDVLQLIGVSLITLQLLVPICRSRRVFMGVTFTLMLLVVFTTATAWQTDWTGRVPSWVAPYLSPATGSLFPLLPWSGYVLLGAALGQLYARWGAANLTSFARWALLAPGAVLLLLAFISRLAPYPEFMANPFDTPPRDFAFRTGPCLIVMGVVAIASRSITHLPRVFAAVAQESLLIYFVHVCIVYGSVWNTGLWTRYASSLGPWGTLTSVVFVVVTTASLAYVWNLWKHVHPKTARVTAWLVGLAMLAWVI